MLRVFIALAILLPTSALAAKKTPTPDQLCRLKGSWASVVMRARQMGMPLSKQIEMSANAPGGSRDAVIAAYKYPRYSTLEMQGKAVEDFRNEVELKCFGGN